MREHIWVNSRTKRLSVMIHQPANFVQGTPVVVLCHGFTGDKVGANQLTKNLAEYIETLGYGVIRFDYIGSGDSEGNFAEDTNVAGWREDLDNILAWTEKQSAFRQSPILLYGHSLGGLVVLTHPGNDERIVGRIVFAPVTEAIKNFRHVILGEELWQQALAGNTIKNFYGRAFTLKPQFVEDLVGSSYDPITNVKKATAPFLFIHGTNDVVVAVPGTQVVYDAYQGDKKLVIKDFDHVAAGQQEELQEIIGRWLTDKFPKA